MDNCPKDGTNIIDALNKELNSSPTPFTEAMVKKLANQFKEDSKNFCATSNVRFMDTDGNFDRPDHHARECHSLVRSISTNSSFVLVATENGWMRSKDHHYGKGKDENTCKGFIDWLLSSPEFSPLIVNKDDREYIDNYGFIIRTDISTPYLQNLFILTRHPYEVGPLYFNMFDRLVSKGYDPLVVATLVFSTGVSLSAKANERVTPNCAHRCYQHPTSFGPLKQLYLRKPVDGWYKKYWGKFSDGRRRYEGGASMYGQEPDYLSTSRSFFSDLIIKRKDLQELLKVFRNDTKGLKMPEVPNPFTPPTWHSRRNTQVSKPYDFSYKEMEEVLIPWLLTAIF